MKHPLSNVAVSMKAYIEIKLDILGVEFEFHFVPWLLS